MTSRCFSNDLPRLTTKVRSVLIVGAVAVASACSESPTTADPSNAGSIEVVSARSIEGLANTAVGAVPQVVVLDDRGAPVERVPVAFTVVRGGGSVLNATTVTSSSGKASAGGWVLGELGTNVVVASASGFAGTTFTAQAVPPDRLTGETFTLMQIAGGPLPFAARNSVPVGQTDTLQFSRIVLGNGVFAHEYTFWNSSYYYGEEFSEITGGAYTRVGNSLTFQTRERSAVGSIDGTKLTFKWVSPPADPYGDGFLTEVTHVYVKQ